MKVPRGLTAKKLVRALLTDGFTLRRTRGSHRIYRHEDGRRVIVAYHRLGDSIPVGTLQAILADAGWSEHDLVRLGLKPE